MDIDHDKSGHDDAQHSVLNYVKDISNTNVSKQKFIESLKYDYETVQTEVQSKMEELKKLKESNSSLNSYLNSHKFMMNELQKTEEADASEINVNRETVQNLRDEMAKLKQFRNEDLICYEEKVTNMTRKFIEGPFNCDPSLLSGKMTKLLEIQTDVRKELENIQKDLEIVRKKFNLEQVPFISHGAPRLQTLQETTEEENAALALENEKLHNEIESLGKTAKGLQQEISELKQQHRFDK